jgi:hypothetical protein
MTAARAPDEFPAGSRVCDPRFPRSIGRVLGRGTKEGIDVVIVEVFEPLTGSWITSAVPVANLESVRAEHSGGVIGQEEWRDPVARLRVRRVEKETMHEQTKEQGASGQGPALDTPLACQGPTGGETPAGVPGDCD